MIESSHPKWGIQIQKTSDYKSVQGLIFIPHPYFPERK